MWISPKYQDTDFKWPLRIEDKISIFLDRTFGWQLNIADYVINGGIGTNGVKIAPIKHSGFAVLSIVFSYFEMIAKYQDGFSGIGKSCHYFKKGLYSVFPELKKNPEPDVNKLLDALYEGVRCGLYHAGVTDHRIILAGGIKSPILFDTTSTKLIINPHLIVPALKHYLEVYGRQLQDANNSELRKRFEKRFDFDASR